MILIVKDTEDQNLVIRDATIVRTYRNNSLGFWCVYTTPTGTNEGQFFVPEEGTLQIYNA
jgi:hypothetical protein